MRLRIAIRASVGAHVVVFWSLYFSATNPASHATSWTLICLTIPIALARHYVLSVYLVLLVNAATYALAGAVAEILWRHHKHIALP